jgi:hypothetical protein
MIFSSVDSLIESVGRTRARKWSELDTLTCLWTGPSWLSDNAPGIGATHPTYTNMELNASRKLSDVAGITRIQLDYVGLFDGGGMGPIAHGSSGNEGELEYQEPISVNTFQWIAGANSVFYQGSPVDKIYTWKVYTRSYVIRYFSLNNTFRYVRKGSGGPIGGGGSILSSSIRPAGGSQTTYAQGTLFAPFGGIEYYLGLGPWNYSEDTFCSSFTEEPISPSWYRCSETWSARYIAG